MWLLIKIIIEVKKYWKRREGKQVIINKKKRKIRYTEKKSVVEESLV